LPTSGVDGKALVGLCDAVFLYTLSLYLILKVFYIKWPILSIDTQKFWKISTFLILYKVYCAVAGRDLMLNGE
jgi:hypothetical protein